MKRSRITALLTAAVTAAGACLAGAAPAVRAEESLRVMPLGDSITDGFNVTAGYRKPLWYALYENGYIDTYHLDFVGPNGWYIDDKFDYDHAGYSGYAIADCPGRQGIYNFVDWLLDEYPADIVMLQIGTNDILSSYDLENAGARLELLVDAVLSHLPEDGALFLATIPYMDADVTTYTDAYTAEEMDAAVDAYNAQVRAVVAKEQAAGKNVILSDNNAALTKADLADGVHPSEDGYAKLGMHWYDVLTRYLDGTEQPTEPTDPIPTETWPTDPIPTETWPTETIPTETWPTETPPTDPIPTETWPTDPTTTETDPTETATEPPLLRGDVDEDGDVDLTDIVLLQKYLLAVAPLGPSAYEKADMDADGRVDVMDLGHLKRAVLWTDDQ